MRDHILYLKDILAAIHSIQAFVEGMDFHDFKSDDKTLSAVIRKFEVIGEATKHVPAQIRDQYPAISWKEMAGMRDRLIHFYFGVDTLILWQTIQENLPDLQVALEVIIEDLS
jgi:uncharacterized protein with HEPN domain